MVELCQSCCGLIGILTVAAFHVMLKVIACTFAGKNQMPWRLLCLVLPFRIVHSESDQAPKELKYVLEAC